jgi:hypothetical protein
MTTKFSARPAPRKRPWICKRSPPCLPVPPIQKSLLVTFSYDHHVAPPPAAAIAGTITVQNLAPTTWYIGSWSNGSDNLTIDVTFDPATNLVDAFVQWTAGPFFDRARYPAKLVAPPPTLRYEHHNIDADFFRWTSVLLITC